MTKDASEIGIEMTRFTRVTRLAELATNDIFEKKFQIINPPINLKVKNFT